MVQQRARAQNGHAYTAIGGVLIAKGEIAREDMSMAAIGPGSPPIREADELMNRSASVFFEEIPVLDDPALGRPGGGGRRADATPQPRGRCPRLGLWPPPSTSPDAFRPPTAWRRGHRPADDRPGHRRRDPRRGAWRPLLRLGAGGASRRAAPTRCASSAQTRGRCPCDPPLCERRPLGTGPPRSVKPRRVARAGTHHHPPPPPPPRLDHPDAGRR